MKVLLVNGPPRSGKDTIATLLKNSNPSFVHLEKFARPMKQIIPIMYSIPLKIWQEHLDTPENKDIPCSELMGKTPRQVQIHLSEAYFKGLHNTSVFGELLIKRLLMLHMSFLECAVVSDCGFKAEALRIVEQFGADNVQLWRVIRDGCTFKTDSRSYISLEDHGVREYDITNNGCVDDLRDLVVPLYNAFTLPREQVLDEKGRPTGDLEDQEAWLEKQQQAAQRAFIEWPTRRIERIKKGSVS